jgi:plastocyanin
MRAIRAIAFVVSASFIGAMPTPRLNASRMHASAGGTIIGVISTKEVTRQPIRATVDSSVCGATVPDESVVVDPAGHLANAVVTATGVRALAPADVLIVNEKCRFVPRVATIRPAGLVKVTSHDSVLHTTHASAANGKVLFNVSSPIPNLTLSKPVDQPGLVKLNCDTHAWMRGFLMVTDELSAVTGVDGSFRLDGVPAGVVELRVWHEELHGATQNVTVKDGQTVRIEATLVK